MPGWMNHKLESKECQQKYQESHICRWYHSNDRNWKTKEPLDESERGEWKSWLKTQRWKNKDHGIYSHHFMANRWGKWKQWQILFSWAPKSLWMVTAATKLKHTCSLVGKLWQPRQHIKKQGHYFANRGVYSQSYGFSRILVWMWELDHKKGWTSKNWCFWTVTLETTLESPFDCKEIKPVLKEISPEFSIGKTEAEASILWPPGVKSQLIGKDPDAGKDWEQEEKGVTENEMVGWHHRDNGREFEQTRRTGKSDMLQFMGSKSVRHDLATEQ